LALTYKDGEKITYLNGEAVHINTEVTGTLIVNENTFMGCTPLQILHLNSLMDELRIYNRVLSPEEIQAIFNEDFAISEPTILPGIMNMKSSNKEMLLTELKETGSGLNLLIYPNPTSGQITVFTNKNHEDLLDISITASNGKIMDHVITSENKVNINMKNYQTGIYFIRVIDNKGVTIQRVVKR
jgi:hypothetical protein